jgi:hypothetical protein
MNCCDQLREDFNNLEKRVLAIESANKPVENNAIKTIELEICLPKANIEGLRFNKQTVKSVFELKEGVYYSKDILFLSARNLENNTERDFLSDYLNNPDVKAAFINAIHRSDGNNLVDGVNLAQIEIFLPKENQGLKQYNGVFWWYWCKPASSSSSLAIVLNSGVVHVSFASSVGGCAPAFCVDRH